MGTDKEKALKEDTQARAVVSLWAVEEILKHASDTDECMISHGDGKLKKVKCKDARTDPKKVREWVDNKFKDSVLQRYRGEVGVQTLGKYSDGDFIIDLDSTSPDPLKIIGLSDDASKLLCEDETGKSKTYDPEKTDYWVPEKDDYLEVRVRTDAGGEIYRCGKVEEVDKTKQVVTVEYFVMDNKQTVQPWSKGKLTGQLFQGKGVHRFGDVRKEGITIQKCRDALDKEASRTYMQVDKILTEEENQCVDAFRKTTGSVRVDAEPMVEKIKNDAQTQALKKTFIGRRCQQTKVGVPGKNYQDSAALSCCKDSTCNSLISKSYKETCYSTHSKDVKVKPEKQPENLKPEKQWIIYYRTWPKK